jgi:hypothetical protein
MDGFFLNAYKKAILYKEWAKKYHDKHISKW